MAAKSIPGLTIETFARSIYREAVKYGFSPVDIVRLVNSLIDMSIDGSRNSSTQRRYPKDTAEPRFHAQDEYPLESERLSIRQATPADASLLGQWLADDYGRHFLLSSATAQKLDIVSLLTNPNNEVGIVETRGSSEASMPIGAVAYLDIDKDQQRAELRKLIGVGDARGKGYAEEATRLWVQYGVQKLSLRKIYVSTLQTHIRNIRLNEAIGFRVEGILRSEVRLGQERHDVLRMGYCAPGPGEEP